MTDRIDTDALRRLAEALLPDFGNADFDVACDLSAVIPRVADELDALRDRLARMTEARDNARAEVERLAAAVGAGTPPGVAQLLVRPLPQPDLRVRQGLPLPHHPRDWGRVMTYLPGTFAIIGITILIALVLMHLATRKTRAQARRDAQRTTRRTNLARELQTLVAIARFQGSTVTDEDVDRLVLTSSTDTLALVVAAYRELVGK